METSNISRLVLLSIRVMETDFRVKLTSSASKFSLVAFSQFLTTEYCGVNSRILWKPSIIEIQYPVLLAIGGFFCDFCDLPLMSRRSDDDFDNDFAIAQRLLLSLFEWCCCCLVDDRLRAPLLCKDERCFVSVNSTNGAVSLSRSGWALMLRQVFVGNVDDFGDIGESGSIVWRSKEPALVWMGGGWGEEDVGGGDTLFCRRFTMVQLSSVVVVE